MPTLPPELLIWWSGTLGRNLVVGLVALSSSAGVSILAEGRAEGGAPLFHTVWPLYALAVGVPLALVVAVARDFLRYRGWRSRLPFVVRGWERLLGQERLADRGFWWQAELEFELDEPGALPGRFQRFLEAAGSAFYAAADREEDPRERWGLQGRVARGSLDNKVAWLLARWLERELAPEGQALGLRAVELRLHEPGKYIRPESD